MDFINTKTELEKWSDPNFEKKIEKELNAFTTRANKRIGEVCLQEIKGLPNEFDIIERYAKEKRLGTGREIMPSFIDIVDEKDSIGRSVINAGVDAKNGHITISKFGAELYYLAFEEFQKGYVKDIRPLNYERPMHKFMQNAPTQKEILYWCYANDIMYEELLESSIVHELTHLWTMQQTGFDDLTNTLVVEGVVELHARKFSKEMGLDYIPFFRHNETILATKFLNILSEQDIKMFCFGNNIREFMSTALTSEVRQNLNIKSNFLERAVENTFAEPMNALYHDMKEGRTKSFLDILEHTKPVDFNKIDECLINIIGPSFENSMHCGEAEIEDIPMLTKGTTVKA